MKKQFTDSREPRLKTDALQQLSMFIDVAETQTGLADGIIADISIENSHESIVSVLNPFESLKLLLVDKAGYPVKLPEKAPNLLINSKNQAWEFDVAFPVTRFSVNGQVVDTAEIEKEVLSIDGGGSQTARFVIDRILEANQETVLPSGTYGISGVGSFINAEDKDESRVLKLASITVQFTRKADE